MRRIERYAELARGVGGSAGTGKFVIVLLLDDVRIAPGTSSKTALDQQVKQLETYHRTAAQISMRAQSD